MPTAKKSTKKTIKRTAPRKRVVRKTVAAKSFKSFVIQPEKGPFMLFKITEQTVYWLFLVLIILLLGLWVLKIQINISDLLDNVHVAL